VPVFGDEVVATAVEERRLCRVEADLAGWSLCEVRVVLLMLLWRRGAGLAAC